MSGPLTPPPPPAAPPKCAFGSLHFLLPGGGRIASYQGVGPSVCPPSRDSCTSHLTCMIVYFYTRAHTHPNTAFFGCPWDMLLQMATPPTHP